MTEQIHATRYAGNPAENYQRYFVPSIGAPVADDLIETAGPRAGQRVLDVACGTGVVARLAAERVGATGAVAGLDLNPCMLAIARAQASSGATIDWYEANAEAMPFPAGSFDIVLCQMGLQFVANKLAALREIRRVLDIGGRAWVNVPGPKPAMFGILTDALFRHLGPAAASFGDLVFSMHDVDELTELMRSAGFREIDVESKPRTLPLPPPADFLWQYINSTPLAQAAAQADESTRDAIEREVCAQWQDFVQDGALSLQVHMTTATGVRLEE